MYSYKRMNGGEYVIHDDTGCSLPYHGKTIRYTEMDIPEWKYDYFNRWIVHYSKAMRENVKKMSTEKTNQAPGYTITAYGNIAYPTSSSTYVTFAPLPTSVAVPADDCCKKQEGNKPMRINETYATAAITNPKSDESIQRDYLLGRLNGANYPKREELTKIFNLYVNNAPKTYKELIDAIKNDKFKLDTKRTARIDQRIEDMDDEECFYGGIDAYDGILWDGPQSDPKGYHTAIGEMATQDKAARDAIMTGDAAAGLTALQAFEAWLPETGTKAN